MSKSIQEILDNAKFVNQQLETSIPTTTGFLTADVIDAAKTSFLGQTVGIWKDELIKSFKQFPDEGFIDLNFSIDAVFMTREEFLKLKEFIEATITAKEAQKDE